MIDENYRFSRLHGTYITKSIIYFTHLSDWHVTIKETFVIHERCDTKKKSIKVKKGENSRKVDTNQRQTYCLFVTNE